uniref:Uncharacterized protein n=2 Tax=Candidatus Kentrum eta TaxID=2126337 RepID=A0A450VJS9_9GAMM|nr:MAG: hypothetical protein BECKH772A_GA0070896_104991 [Candidatus Kentron sp. H]VFK08237.1 MAG: hypothetical protein BECKH772C_GA0070978_104971 [Candidatus Kentron sp. H]VFK08611.1 MAG: hypothetical protein BECKH772A_GA0070896_108791 [Candidatus Kentron sp. H]
MLYLTRRPTLGSLYELAHLYVRKNLCKNVHMVARNHTIENIYSNLLRNLSHQLAHSLFNLMVHHPVTIFRNPYQVVSVVENCVSASAVILHANDAEDIMAACQTESLSV